MKRHKLILAIAIACLLFSGITGIARAYRTGHSWSSNSVYYDPDGLPDYNWRNAAWYGAKQWNDVSSSSFNWTPWGSSLNDLTLDYIDGEYNALAVTETDEDWQGNLIEADITFDSAESWYTGSGDPGSDLDARSVAAHEFGHALELLHTQWWHCAWQPLPTMCSYYAYGQTYFRSLETDDENGVSALYP